MRGRSCENNHSPTPIDGVWVVVLQSPRGRWQRAFFERNRAHLLVLRSVDGKDEQHHFEVDEASFASGRLG